MTPDNLDFTLCCLRRATTRNCLRSKTMVHDKRLAPMRIKNSSMSFAGSAVSQPFAVLCTCACLNTSNTRTFNSSSLYEKTGWQRIPSSQIRLVTSGSLMPDASPSRLKAIQHPRGLRQGGLRSDPYPGDNLIHHLLHGNPQHAFTLQPRRPALKARPF